MTTSMDWYTQSLAVAFALLFISTFFTLMGLRRKLAEREATLQRMFDLMLTQDGELGPAAQKQTLEPLAEGIAKVHSTLAAMNESHRHLRSVSPSVALDDAVALARQGRTAEDIAARSALGLSEAQLLVRLHGAHTENKG